MLRRSLVILTAVISASLLSAQKVGLVMSGGGAKGLYHIGVIKALEENGIPIDCVAGTSMGSVIAGLYAAGYSPYEIEDMVRGDMVQKWVSGQIDMKYTHLYREIEAPPSMLRFNMDLRRKDGKERKENTKVSVPGMWQKPADLISSSQIDVGLGGLLHPASVAAHGDFDKLMVPFLCVAADAVTKKAVVLRKGNLDEAVRASMSIPMAFKPMEDGDRLLYDGGLRDNFPWKPCRDCFAPDHMIGSVCTSNSGKVTARSNLIDQALLLMSVPTDYTLPEGDNILISRALTDGMLDFGNATPIIQKGYDDTMARMEEIKAVIKVRRSPEEVAELRKAFRSTCPELRIDSVHVDGLSVAQRKYVGKLFSRHMVNDGSGKFCSYGEYQAGLYEMLAEKDFTIDYPRLVYDGQSGTTTPWIRAKLKPQMDIVIGGNLSTTTYNQIRLGLAFRHVGKVQMNAHMGFFVGPSSIIAMANGQVVTHPMSPLVIDAGYVFSLTNTLYGNFGNLTQSTDAYGHRLISNFAKVSFGWVPENRSILQLTAHVGQDSYKFSREHTDKSNYTFLATRLMYRRSTLDDIYWPVKGHNFEASGIVVTGVEDQWYKDDELTYKRLDEHRSWHGLKVSWRHHLEIPSVKWFSIGYLAEGVLSTHETYNIEGGGSSKYDYDMASQMSMPEFTPTQHSKLFYLPEYHAAKFLGLGVMPTFRIAGNLYVRTGLYAMFRDRSYGFGQWKYIADLSVAYRTRFGSLDLSLTKYGFDSIKDLYLALNFGHLIFAPKSTFY